MGADVSAEVAGLISDAKVFGSSDNIRHGRYQMLIKRIFSELVENDAGKHRMAFWELTPVKSEPNPQFDGDRVDYTMLSPGTGPLKDDGTRPNEVGSNCALKVNFDGSGGRSAGSNIKQAVLALFNKRDGEITNDEVSRTWMDLSRQKDLKVGDPIGIDSTNNQVIYATKAKRANPACGMLINCYTVAKKKKTANEKGAYVTKLVWECASPPNTGVNAPEEVARRRAEIEASQVPDDDEEAATPPAALPPNIPGMAVGANPSTLAATGSIMLAPPAPPAPPGPPPAPPAPFAPPAGWVKHSTAFVETAPPEARWYHNPLTNAVASEAQLRVSK